MKSSNVKTTKTGKAKITTIIITIVQQSSVRPTNKVIRYKQVKHTSYKRSRDCTNANGLTEGFKPWTIERLGEDVHLLIVCVDKFKTHNSFFYQVSNEMVTYLYVLRF